MSAVIVHPDLKEFENLISGDKPVLVDFWAEWCGPCRMLGPVIEQLSQHYDGRAVIAKVNVDEQRMLSMRFDVQSIPTVMVFHKGVAVDTIIGLRTADVYQRAIDALL